MKYDVAIIGGGLAGLSFSIDLRKRGYSVIVIEKGSYPRHKVCGEYISMESHDYLFRLCPKLAQLDLPSIMNFKLSSTGNSEFQTKLDLGGFGISRYLLEELLYYEAKSMGVEIKIKCKALAIPAREPGGVYTIKTKDEDIQALLVCNASGRKSNFETMERESLPTGTNYIGIKYHVRIERDPGFVEIHNFPGGYCGVSGVEEGKTCLCYIVNSAKLNSVGNSINELEAVHLSRNPRLKYIFEHAEFLYKDPLAVSGINFRVKDAVNDTSIFLGDSAGSIAPVTGNGMSMALRSAAFLADTVDRYFNHYIRKDEMIANYSAFWEKEFSKRVNSSRHFQKLSEYPLLTNLMINIFKPFPSLAKRIIRRTHGTPF